MQFPVHKLCISGIYYQTTLSSYASCNGTTICICPLNKHAGSLWSPCRPESRQGQLPTSQLGGQRASSALPQGHAYAPDMQSEQAAGAQPHSQSYVHSGQAAGEDSMQSEHAVSIRSGNAVTMQSGLQSGMPSEKTAGSSSMPDGLVHQEGTYHEAGHAAADLDSCSMTLVEAAALAASSPGAVVHVPTSTTLSQADQIALRYQNQVRSPVASHTLHCSCICFSLCMP